MNQYCVKSICVRAVHGWSSASKNARGMKPLVIPNCQWRPKQISKKNFQILSTRIVFAPDEVFDTYVDITDDLYLDVQSFKRLIQKPNTYR